MTWSHWLVPPFPTSIFFVLGFLTLYQVSYSWLTTQLHEHQVKISDDFFKTWYGILYMLVFVFSLQSLVVGQSNSWAFMNFELIAVTFCAYFLNIRIPVYFLFPIVLVYMLFNGSFTYWQSWGHALTLMAFFWILNLIRVKLHDRQYTMLVYLVVTIPFGGLLWLWMKWKFALSWTTFGQEWLYLVVFEVLLYSYTAMLSRDSRTKSHLAQLASHDALTGILNYETYRNDVHVLFAESKKRQRSLAMIMFDIDHFKLVNDTYGHAAGDQVLRAIAKTVDQIARDHDPKIKFYRTGGEEFNLILPEYTLVECDPIAQQIFTTVDQLEIAIDPEQVVQVTISVGISIMNEDDQTSLDFYNRVDHNLYHSKRNGRHQITSS
ncbi:GGDEF domain-containing protein [Lapidilactobacillus luobeiensis]|uniref:GGDEF domain-containing protein n=1 Tax=Lapidilactobacillus luobeiensis TaxID=2950371 RepID=UPI0028529FA6|nr:GGDEF domain-containing protein [Lapidilactobacillus luobeiensis]